MVFPLCRGRIRLPDVFGFFMVPVGIRDHPFRHVWNCFRGFFGFFIWRQIAWFCFVHLLPSSHVHHLVRHAWHCQVSAFPAGHRQCHASCPRSLPGAVSRTGTCLGRVGEGCGRSVRHHLSLWIALVRRCHAFSMRRALVHVVMAPGWDLLPVSWVIPRGVRKGRKEGSKGSLERDPGVPSEGCPG